VNPNVNGGCLDLAFRGDTANDFLFAACGMLQGQSTVYRSTNAEGDGAWAAVLTEANMGRTTLAIAPSNPSVVYALAAHNGGTFDQGLHAVFRSTAGGAAGTWTAQVRTAANPSAYGHLLLTNPSSATTNECRSTKTTNLSNMGWHANVIAVDPKDPDRVWAAGVDLFRSDNGGRNWGVASYWAAPESASSFVHADQHGIVLIADEVQSGYGRTGKMFGIEHFGVEPDLITVAKSIAAGLPLSAVIGRAEIMDAPGDSAIGGTYVGNPVAQAAALAVLDVFEEESLVERAGQIGNTIRGRMQTWQQRWDAIGDVRGLGAMLAIELVHDRDTKDPAPELATKVVEAASERGLLLLKSGIYSNCIRVLVPLVISDAELDEALGAWEDALGTALR
jgi:hypothetical protein